MLNKRVEQQMFTGHLYTKTGVAVIGYLHAVKVEHAWNNTGSDSPLINSCLV
jgi:hypothetical protein